MISENSKHTFTNLTCVEYSPPIQAYEFKKYVLTEETKEESKNVFFSFRI